MKGKVVAVTGGYGALGRVVAATAADRGASVAALDFAPTPPDGLAERLGPNAAVAGRRVDLSSGEHARAAIANVVAKFGRLDALINIAGGFRWEKVESGDAASWDRLFAINLKDRFARVAGGDPSSVGEGGAGRIVNVGAHFGGESRRGNGTPTRPAKGPCIG